MLLSQAPELCHRLGPQAKPLIPLPQLLLRLPLLLLLNIVRNKCFSPLSAKGGKGNLKLGIELGGAGQLPGCRR